MNYTILMGRLTRDPELKQTPNGVSVARFSLAVNRRFSKDGQADFINCIAWRQTGEFISKYFQKGSMIAVVGSIQSRSWDGQDGKKQYTTEVVVNEAYFTGSKNETQNNGYENQAQNFDMDTFADGLKQLNEEYDGFADLDTNEDDLPF